jgi:hypothetical protein
LKIPESIIGKAQGRLFVAGVPQAVGKMSLALLDTPLIVARLGLYVFRMCVPNVFG